MERRIEDLQGRTFDLAVIGGGMFGACAAWEAASRGLSVALLEQGDFGAATSANSFKIVHGGIRYLQHLDLGRVWSSSTERANLLRVAPHLVEPVPIVIPTYGSGMQGRLPLRIAFALYDGLTAARNRGITDPERHIPPARALSREQVLSAFPGVPEDGLTGGIVFCDGQMYNTPRLTLSFLKSAAERGAVLVNHAEAVGIERDGSQVTGLEVVDRETGLTHRVRASAVLNAAGPWASRLVEELAGVRWNGERPVFSRDIGLVVRRRLEHGLGLASLTRTRDRQAVGDRGGRHLFLLPWRDRALVGVWHGVWRGPADAVEVHDDELARLIDEANAAFPGLALTPEDVAHVITGLILYGQRDARGQAGAASPGAEGFTFGDRSLLVDHAEDGVDGLFTLIGVRATMARGEAERAVDRIGAKLGRGLPRSRTATTPVAGGDFESTFDELIDAVPRASAALEREDVRRALAHNHGSRFRDVLSEAERDPALLDVLPGSTVLRAEVVHACRREMARTLSDVVLRRTDLATAGWPGDQALAAAAALAAEELGWSDERSTEELAAVKAFLARRGAVRRFRDPRARVGS